MRNSQDNRTARVNINELIYDGAVILYGFLFSDLVMNGRTVSIPPVFLISLYIVSMFFLYWIMGILYARFEIATNSKLIKRAVATVIAVVLISVLFIIMGLSMTLQEKKLLTETTAMSLGISAIVAAIMGLMFGGVAWGTELNRLKKKDDHTADNEVSAGSIIIAITLGLIPFFLYMVHRSSIPRDHGAAGRFMDLGIGVVIVFGGALSIVVVIILFLMIKKLILWLRLFEPWLKAQRLISPFFFATVFCLYSHLVFGSLEELWSAPPSPLVIALVLTMTGLLPFRIMLMLTPPIRGINIMVGVLAFAEFIVFRML